MGQTECISAFGGENEFSARPDIHPPRGSVPFDSEIGDNLL